MSFYCRHMLTFLIAVTAQIHAFVVLDQFNCCPCKSVEILLKCGRPFMPLLQLPLMRRTPVSVDQSEWLRVGSAMTASTEKSLVVSNNITPYLLCGRAFPARPQQEGPLIDAEHC